MPTPSVPTRAHLRLPARLARRAAVLCVLLLAAAQVGAVDPPAVAPRIDAIISNGNLSQGFWGIFVQDVASGDVLYRENADKPFMPASNEKLLTTAAALDAFGGDYRYRTTLYLDGEVDGNVLRGDLIIRGSGDPTFGSIETGGGDPLRHWARTLAQIGVQRVEGRIVGDDDAFGADRPYAEGWDINYVTHQASRSLGVAASALSYHDNVVEVKVEAAGSGDRPRITTRPDGYLDVRNKLTTSGRRRGISVNTDRAIGSETITLTGSLPRSYAGTIVLPVSNPTLFAAHAFKQHLVEAGVAVEGEAVDVDEIEEEPDLAGARPLFVHVSPPLAEIIKVVNKESNNFYAEQVFRSLGGSAEAGERRIEVLLAASGAATDAVSIRDGSGLSRKNMVTAEAMGKLLTHMRRHAEREPFVASLPQGGEARSTLRYRLHGVPVRAKTGSLEYVRALSGYATTSGGRELAFAVFANNYTTPSYQITQGIDEIVRTLSTEM